MRRLLTFLLHLLAVLAILYFGLAIHYWLGWPGWVRDYGSLTFVLAMLLIWFLPLRGRMPRRLGVLTCIAVLATFYATKKPVERDWIPLHEKRVTAVIDGDVAHLENFRDAIHTIGQPAEPRWTKRSFDLSQLERAEFILQPFGTSKATEHAMITFGFADGRHIVVSMEARRAEGAGFDALAGFFRHDQIYPIIGTERDLIWKRLARDPPFEMQFYPIKRSPEAVRAYFETVLAFANAVNERPQFYNTIRESCLTTLIRLAPGTFSDVPWYDYRQWIPGYSIELFQDLGLVDDSVSAEELTRQRALRSGIGDPAGFPDDPSWSEYLRLE